MAKIAAKQAKKNTRYVVPKIARAMLDDDLGAWNVYLTVQGTTVVLATIDAGHADILADQLNKCAWVEVRS